MDPRLKYLIGIGSVLVILTLSTLTVQFYIEKDYTSIYRDGDLIARTRWHVEAERTYINKISWYDKNVRCPKIIDLGGHETETRCYYPDNYYEMLSRSLINTEVNIQELINGLIVTRDTPFYAYGTRGAYAGILNEFFKFLETDKPEEFPEDYQITWDPKDTRNYKLVWRVWELDEINLPDGKYHDCHYYFGNINIDLMDACKDLEYAEIINAKDQIWFYFNSARGLQTIDVKLVDPSANYSNPWIGAHNRDTNGLVGEWRFENSNATFTEDETGVNNGSVSGATLTNEGRVGRGYKFDGTNDLINVDSSTSLNFENNTDFTVSLWVKTNDTTGNNVLVEKKSPGAFGSTIGWYFRDNAVGIDSNNYVSVSLTGVTDNNWHHLVAVFDRDSLLSVYRDGVFNISKDISSVGNVSNTEIMGIGNRGSLADLFFNGTLDEVIIFNRTLSATEISQMYDISRGDYGYTDNDLGCSANISLNVEEGYTEVYNWKINGTPFTVLNMPFEGNLTAEGGTKVMDYSGFGNNGTVTNAVWNSTGGHDGFGAYEFKENYSMITINKFYLNKVSNWTASYWIKTETSNEASLGCNNSDDYHIELGISSGGKARYRYYTSLYGWAEIVGLSDIVDNNWHNLVFIMNDTGNGNIKIYVDGVLEKDQECNNGTVIAIRYINTIGGIYSTSNYINGSMDDVLIFNRTLSAEQVKSLYESGLRNIVSEETNADDNWTCSIIPVNATDEGESLTSNELDVLALPEVSITYPSSEVYDANVSAINYTATGSDLDQCWYSKNDGATNSSPVDAGINFTGISSTSGENTWFVYCNDTQSTIAQDSATFNVSSLWFGETPDSVNSFRATEFVNVSGNNFTLGGSPYTMQGVNAYYLTDYATNHTYDDDGNEINNSQQYVLEILNEAQYLNFNVLRTWAGMQGGGCDEYEGCWNVSQFGGHYNLFEVGEPGNYSEDTLQALDWVIYQASQRDIRIQLVPVNNWDEYGGMRWYVMQSPTTNKTYANVTNNGYDNWSEFHDQFYNDSNTKTYFKNWLYNLSQRNNTYTGNLYKNEPAIFSWSLANEPRAKSDADRSGDLMRNWTIEMVDHLKNNCSVQQLVTLGIEGFGDPFEGTEFVIDHNETNVDYATYALHASQWDWFAQRGENATDEAWQTGGYSNNDTINWWTSDVNTSWNNRYEGSYVPNYSPALPRHNYDNWVKQNVAWANDMEMPVVIQEVAFNQTETYDMRYKYYSQAINTFYTNGGDGFMYWNFNHDNYYYSTENSSFAGKMDDDYSFYLSDDTTLNNRSLAVRDAINYTDANAWTTQLNNHKYDFNFNIGKANDINIDNCSLYLNIYNGSWSGSILNETQTNIVANTDNLFTKQFGDYDTEVNWSIECVANDSEIITSSTNNLILQSSTPTITLISPDDGTGFNASASSFNYTVSNAIDITYCELYIDGILNKTDTTIDLDTPQSFSVLVADEGSHNWSINCEDIDNNIGSSSTNDFVIDLTYPLIEFDSTTTSNGSLLLGDSIFVNLTTSDSNDFYVLNDFDKSLVGWWRFENSNATFTEDETGVNNGTVTGANLTDDGRFGRGYEFETSSSNINVGSSSIFDFTSEPFTISMWVKPNGNYASYPNLMVRENYGVSGYTIYQDPNGLLKFLGQGAGGDLSSVSIIPTNEWSHVLFTRNGTDAYWYIDGGLDASTSSFNDIISMSKDLTISRSSGQNYQGLIDEVAIFNRSLSAEEVSSLYNASATSYEKNFTGLSKGDHTYKGYVVDIAGNLNETEEWTSETLICSPPTSGDWNLNCSNNCTWGSNMNVPADLSTYGIGELNLNANMTFTSSNQFMFINPGCSLNINPGGSFR